jgi:O-antigen/teichoic acid export membrane protein
LSARLADGSDRSIAQKVAGTAFLIRVVSAALIYGSQILFARWMGSFEFGIYVYVWTWVTLIGDLADLGLGSAAQRFVPKYRQNNSLDLLRGFVVRSRWLAIGTATVVAVIGAVTVKLLEPWLASYVVLPLMVACAVLPFYALMQIQDGIARSYNWIRLALLPLYIVRHVVMLLLIGAAFLLDFATNAVTVVSAVGLSFAVTAIGQTIMLNRRIAREIAPGPRKSEVGVWYAVSVPIILVEGFYLMLTSIDILVLQQFRSPDDVAIYYAAAKTLTLVTFVYFAVSAAVTHRFSEYHAAGDRQRLADILADSIRWTFWPSVAATIVILAIGQPLLSLFGARFVEGYPLMLILAVGLLARASVGPLERLLSMLGEQRVCTLIYGTAFALNLVLCLTLIPRLGLEGAAIATSAALVVESILLFLATKIRLGLHAFIWGRPRAR